MIKLTSLLVLWALTQSAISPGRGNQVISSGGGSCTLGYAANLVLDLEVGNITSCTGAAVTTWPGTTAAPISGTGVGSPTCVASGGSNGGPYVQLNGTSQYFALSSTTAAGTAGTIFAVMAPSTPGVKGVILDGNAATGALTLYTGTASTTQYGADVSYTTPIGYSNTKLVANAWHDINISYDGANSTFRIDSTADGGPEPFTTPINTNWASVFVGQLRNTGYWGGKAEAVLAYNAALTTTNKQLVESYLRCKYGVL